MSMKSIFALTALFTMAACVSPSDYRQALGANQALKAEIASLTQTQAAMSQENERLRADLERLGKQAADADWIRDQKAKLDKLLATYKDGSASAVPGVELVRTGEGLAFRVLGGVLFPSGRIEISEQGKQTLAQLIATLKQEGKRVRVDGHTDDMPIQHSQWAPTCACRSSDRWRSSTSWSRAGCLPTRSGSPASASIARWKPRQPIPRGRRIAGSRS